MASGPALAEVLDSLSPRVREPQPTTRLVSQVTFELRGDRAFELAVREAIAWMRNRNSSIPTLAFEGEPFRLLGGGVHPAEVVRIARDGLRLWAAILDYPDNKIPRRTWVTEMGIGESGG